MQDRPARRATYDDVIAVPPNMVAEIIDGCLVTHPRPAPRPSVAASNLGMLMGTPFGLGVGGPGGWWIIDEPELHLGADVLVPDLAGWRRERMPTVPETAWFPLPPDWVCEVLSPATRRYDQGEKRDIYGRHGVPHLWLVDPEARLLEAFELMQGKWVLARTWRGDEPVAAAPFAAVPFKLGDLWPD